jgi:hypothetical protein
VILPLAFLFILGLKSLFDLFHKKGGAIAVWSFVAFEFLFLSFVIWRYILPVYHLTVQSPHPGI